MSDTTELCTDPVTDSTERISLSVPPTWVCSCLLPEPVLRHVYIFFVFFLKISWHQKNAIIKSTKISTILCHVDDRFLSKFIFKVFTQVYTVHGAHYPCILLPSRFPPLPLRSSVTLKQWFFICGSWPLWKSFISYPAFQIFIYDFQQ